MSITFRASLGKVLPDSRFASINPSAQFRQIVKNYKEVIADLEDMTPNIIFEALEPTFDLSMQYCPIDTGALRASGYLRTTERGNSPRVEIGYGEGGEPEYTVSVHENLEWRHWRGTRAKWLQAALEETEKQIEDRIISAYQRYFRTGAHPNARKMDKDGSTLTGAAGSLGEGRGIVPILSGGAE
jgi:hypothetical protein